MCILHRKKTLTNPGWIRLTGESCIPWKGLKSLNCSIPLSALGKKEACTQKYRRVLGGVLFFLYDNILLSSRGGSLAWEWEFQLCISLYMRALSKVVRCPFPGCGSAASVCAVTVQCCPPPCTAAGLGHLGMCVMGEKLAILYPKPLQQSPDSWQAAQLVCPGQGSQCRDGLPTALLWALIPALLGCHKPQAFPPSWENSLTFCEVLGWMEEIKSYLPVLVQPCLGLYNMSPLF